MAKEQLLVHFANAHTTGKQKDFNAAKYHQRKVDKGGQRRTKEAIKVHVVVTIPCEH